MLGTPPEAVWHPASAFLHYYIDEGTPVHTGPPWSSRALETTISKWPHASACTLEMIRFIWGKMQRRTQVGFIIFLPAVETVRVFGAKLKLSRIVAVLQAHR